MKALRAVSIFFILALAASCATFNATIVELSKMTPEDVVALAQDTYNKRFLEHEYRTEFMDKLTDQEKQDLQDLKDALVNVYPYIKSFERALEVGVRPAEVDRRALEEFVRDYYYRRQQ